MTAAPDIMNSTAEERRNYIKNRFPCIADCDMCGICKMQKLHMKLIFVERDPLRKFLRITDNMLEKKYEKRKSI
mgnify:CR=1 FL=1